MKLAEGWGIRIIFTEFISKNLFSINLGSTFRNLDTPVNKAFVGMFRLHGRRVVSSVLLSVLTVPAGSLY